MLSVNKKPIKGCMHNLMSFFHASIFVFTSYGRMKSSVFQQISNLFAECPTSCQSCDSSGNCNSGQCDEGYVESSGECIREYCYNASTSLVRKLLEGGPHNNHLSLVLEWPPEGLLSRKSLKQ